MKAELVNISTGERLIRDIIEAGPNAHYFDLGMMGHNKPCGFFTKNGKPLPSNPYKNLRMTVAFR